MREGKEGEDVFQVDLRLAAEVEELDFVVGGHSHSFLFTGNPAPEMVEEVEGDYPTYVTQPSTGRVVPVVQVNLTTSAPRPNDENIFRCTSTPSIWET